MSSTLAEWLLQAEQNRDTTGKLQQETPAGASLHVDYK